MRRPARGACLPSATISWPTAHLQRPQSRLRRRPSRWSPQSWHPQAWSAAERCRRQDCAGVGGRSEMLQRGLATKPKKTEGRRLPGCDSPRPRSPSPPQGKQSSFVMSLRWKGPGRRARLCRTAALHCAGRAVQWPTVLSPSASRSCCRLPGRV